MGSRGPCRGGWCLRQARAGNTAGRPFVVFRRGRPSRPGGRAPARGLQAEARLAPLLATTGRCRLRLSWPPDVRRGSVGSRRPASHLGPDDYSSWVGPFQAKREAHNLLASAMPELRAIGSLGFCYDAWQAGFSLSRWGGSFATQCFGPSQAHAPGCRGYPHCVTRDPSWALSVRGGGGPALAAKRDGR
jgi:hypothetical protein